MHVLSICLFLFNLLIALVKETYIGGGCGEPGFVRSFDSPLLFSHDTRPLHDRRNSMVAYSRDYLPGGTVLLVPLELW
jgi:hypothetical protein